jgi:superfamily II DNA or RNA helicase
MRQLRPYQIEATEAVQKAFANGLRRVGISLPCRCGKTVIMADMASQIYAKGRSVVILVHRDVLVEQTVRRMTDVLPARAVGVVKADRNDINAPVIVASVQTLSRSNRLDQLPRPALTMVDEAHVSAAASYQRVFEYLNAVPGGRGYLVGVSATWARSDGKGLGGTWEEVVYKKSIRWAVRNGYMVPPRALRLGDDLNLSDARRTADGDFWDSDLEKIVMVNDLRDTIVRGYQQHGEGRPAVLFAPTKASARFLGEGFHAQGVKTAEIFDDTSLTHRRYNFAAYTNGAVKVLLTCSALGIGWDEPRCAVALLARPYGHLTPFIQATSRVLTPWPGKYEGLILDFVGATIDKSMRAIVDLSEPLVKEDSDEFTDTLDELEREPSTHLVPKITGVTEVDLWAGSEARWLRTEHGVPFVTTRDHLYWIAQDTDGTWGVGRCSSRSIKDGQWLVTGLASAEALEYGSDAALDEDPSIAGRSSSWRRGNQRPTESQLNMAASLGISTDGLNKSALSDAINVHRATQLLVNVKGDAG